MIGLAAAHSPLLVRRNPDATTFTPEFEINGWNFNFRNLHYLPPIFASGARACF
jgi:hypothetical protein